MAQRQKEEKTSKRCTDLIWYAVLGGTLIHIVVAWAMLIVFLNEEFTKFNDRFSPQRK